MKEGQFTGYLVTGMMLDGDTTNGVIAVEGGKAILALYAFRPSGNNSVEMTYRGERAVEFTCGDALCPESQLELHALKDLKEVRKVLGETKDGVDLARFLDNFYHDRLEAPVHQPEPMSQDTPKPGPVPIQRVDSLNSIKDMIVQYHKRNAERGTRRAGYHELEIDIVEGESYLVEEQSREFSYGIFASMVEDSYKGIGITRINPRLLRSKIEGEKPRILWLTDHESATEETVPPSLEKIMVILEEFILKNDQTVVLVDDLQYLISCNTFEGAVRFIRNLVDKISERSAVFLVSVDPNSLNSQERSVLERELRVVRDR
ncbi:MAG: DUF835 domain-containing protein [Methanomassiliicoccales archaeon]|jgi:hypothetical protein